MRKKRTIISWHAVLSGVVLVLLFAYYLPKLVMAKPPRGSRKVKIFLMTERQEKLVMHEYGKPYQQIRNYVPVHFTGHLAYDMAKLDFARIRVREIIRDVDTLNGVHMTFGDSATFRMYIHVHDMLVQERAQIYATTGEGIWFLHKAD